MKQFFKLIALVLAIAMVAATLCSCRSLDETKANQAFYTDSKKTEITLRENTYRELKIGKLSFINEWNYGYAQGNGCYVTEKDVPALLSSWYGDWYSINEDDSVMFVYGDAYVRKDKYDDLKEVVENSKLDHYVFSYYSDDYYYSNYHDYGYYDTQKNVIVDDDTAAAINRTLGVADNDKVKYDTLSGADYSTKAIRLNPCDENMILADYNTTVYLILDKEKYYVWDGNEYDEYSICPVADDDVALIKALFDKYPNAADWENIVWHFENNYYNYDDTDEYYEEDTPQTNSDGTPVLV